MKRKMNPNDITVIQREIPGIYQFNLSDGRSFVLTGIGNTRRYFQYFRPGESWTFNGNPDTNDIEIERETPIGITQIIELLKRIDGVWMLHWLMHAAGGCDNDEDKKEYMSRDWDSARMDWYSDELRIPKIPPDAWGRRRFWGYWFRDRFLFVRCRRLQKKLYTHVLDLHRLPTVLRDLVLEYS